MLIWEVNADVVEKDYGSYVNRDDNFYICPECGEPVYACDWTNEELVDVICPICGFCEDEDYDDYKEDYDINFEWDSTDLEEGYNPYLGCYDFDC